MDIDIHSEQYKELMPWRVIEWSYGKVQVFVDDGYDEIYVQDCDSLSHAEGVVDEHNKGLQL